MKQNQINLSALDRMFVDLADQAWSQSSDILHKNFCQLLAQECQNRFDQGEFRQASIGRGVSKSTSANIRGDHTLWLGENHSSPGEMAFLGVLNEILYRLNSHFFLGLKRHETHFALYPPGTGYDKHIDNHRGTGSRKITFILYLNENWQPGDGGELSIFAPDDSNKRIAQIEPHLGTLVLFRSELFPHQVEKSYKFRRSVTGWFRDDAL